LLGLLDQLVVGDRLAEAHVDDDLLQLGHLHGVLVAELLHQGRDHLLLVGDAEAGRVLAASRGLALGGLDRLRALLLLALLLAAAAGLLALTRGLGVRHRAFAVGVLLRLVFLLLLVVCHLFLRPDRSARRCAWRCARACRSPGAWSRSGSASSTPDPPAPGWRCGWCRSSPRCRPRARRGCGPACSAASGSSASPRSRAASRGRSPGPCRSCPSPCRRGRRHCRPS